MAEEATAGSDRFSSLTIGRKIKEWAAPSSFTEEFYFVCLADTQLGMIEGMGGSDFLPLVGCDGVKDLYEAEKEFSRTTVNYLNRLRPPPAFVVVCGDLVNAYPSKTNKYAQEVEDFKNIFSKVSPLIKLVCLCGNHDVGEKPSEADVAVFNSSFSADYFYFWYGGVKFISMNSQLYKCDDNAKELALEQDKWFDAQLKGVRVGVPESSPDRRCCVFSHIPPFIDHQDEADGYFSFSSKCRKSLLSRLAKNGCTHWFSGHYHRNVIGTYHDKETGKTIECITTAAVGGNILHTEQGVGKRNELSGMAAITLDRSLSGMRFVFVKKDCMQHKYVSLQMMERKYMLGSGNQGDGFTNTLPVKLVENSCGKLKRSTEGIKTGCGEGEGKEKKIQAMHSGPVTKKQRT